MTISYPLTPPSTPAPVREEWFALSAVSISASPFTFQSQVLAHAGDAWGVSLTFPVMTRAQAAPWMAFLASLRGKRGTFLWGDVLQASPQGAGTGTPLVKGASQTGYTVITDGWTNSTLVLKAGDHFQIDNSLYMNLVDATSDGSGNLTLDIWPSLRGHANDAALDLSSPKCLMRLLENQVRVNVTDDSRYYSIAFAAEEAL